jgi:hypothetical protein
MRAGRPKIGDRATSDVVVRLRTQEGRVEWLYCHSAILAAGSTYFGDCLSHVPDPQLALLRRGLLPGAGPEYERRYTASVPRHNGRPHVFIHGRLQEACIYTGEITGDQVTTEKQTYLHEITFLESKLSGLYLQFCFHFGCSDLQRTYPATSSNFFTT